MPVTTRSASRKTVEICTQFTTDQINSISNNDTEELLEIVSSYIEDKRKFLSDEELAKILKTILDHKVMEENIRITKMINKN